MRLKRSVKRKLKRSLIFMICAFVMSKSVQVVFSLTSEGVQISNINTFIDVETEPVSTAYNGIDVLGLGNSDLYSAFNPYQLWKEYGIPSYVAGAPNSTTPISYQMLQRVFQCQKPKVIVFEVDELFEKRIHQSYSKAHHIAYSNCYSLFSQDRNLLNNPGLDKKTAATLRVKQKGYVKIDKVKPYYQGFSYMVPTNEKEPLDPLMSEYLDKIIKLSKQNNCEILFVSMPSASSWNYAKHNTVSEIAQKYSIPYIDFNVDQMNTGFDWLTDTRDGGNHMNVSGATKLTRYLGNYLKKNYKLENHKNDQNYKMWEKQ